MTTMQAPAFEQRMERVEALVEQIERAPDGATKEAAREMVRVLLDLHAAGIERMLALLPPADAGGRAAFEAWMEDDLVRSLLLLHGLHPADLESRVRQALDSVRPYLHSHGGDVELLEIADGAVRLRMTGSCHGCPSSSATLKSTIEQALFESAPDIAALTVEGVTDTPAPRPGLVQLSVP